MGLAKLRGSGWASTEELPALSGFTGDWCCPASGRKASPVVLMEALASGHPVISTYVAGFLSWWRAVG